MPITEEKAPSNLPDGAKRIYVSAFNSAYDNTCTDRGDRDECAAKIAWSAVKNKYRKSGDTWTPKADVEFSMTIKRAAYAKEASGEMRWRADTSDINPDKRDDNMSIELYQDFLQRIESKEPVPEPFRSSFWSGGMPYISISHYDDMDGKGVPGDVERTYIEGEFLKSKGTFDDTPLGRACFKALCDDLYHPEKSERDDKIRISIAFLDWKHRHKSNDYMFERKSIDEICPECLLELITGEYGGLEYLSGHLIHYALTRIPVNDRTNMEVDKSMTTKKEDAASIVGDELAEELDLEEKAKAKVGKSEALVVTSEEEEPEVEVEKAEAKKEEDEDEEEDEEKEMPEKKKKEKAELTLEQVLSAVEELKSEPEPHILDEVWSVFKSEFDEALETDLSGDERLQLIQESFNAVGNRVVSEIKSLPEPEPIPVDPNTKLLQSIANQMELLTTQLSNTNQPQVDETGVPPRRSIQPNLTMQSDLYKKPEPVTESDTPNLRKLVEATT